MHPLLFQGVQGMVLHILQVPCEKGFCQAAEAVCSEHALQHEGRAFTVVMLCSHCSMSNIIKLPVCLRCGHCST